MDVSRETLYYNDSMIVSYYDNSIMFILFYGGITMTMNELYYKTNNRVARQHIDAYDNTHHFHLWDCYTKYSRNKEQAFARCEELCDRLHGWGLRILSFNSMQFTVGFLFMDEQTGVVRFAYITRDYDRFCDYVQ